MRVLLSSHTYITHQNQRKLDALAALQDIDLRVVLPQSIEGSLHGVIPVDNSGRSVGSPSGLPRST